MAVAPVVEAIAATLGVPPARRAELRVRQGGTGGNSRVYVVDFDGRTAIAKQYFRHPADTRDRLQAEWAFLEYAQRAGIACVPRPLARDAASGIGVYQYIEGRNLGAADISASRVGEAAAFFLALNEAARRSEAALGAASEACFSIAEHLALVDRRIERLRGVAASSDEDRAAAAFVDTLRARWEAVREDVLRTTRAAGADPAAEVEERCISPSDFGFHNALVRDTGDLCFLDFEYAGWDDPAKMVGDFFAHPGIPVPHGYFDAFASKTMGFSRHAAALEARVRLLEPVFRIKWCCIVLNEFVPEAAQRRRFAAPSADMATKKLQQLDKARALLATT
jgi:hypothetical protein